MCSFMTYVFMDLEAVPEKNQMISIGAIYEDKTFYSLSKTDNPEDLTIQIEELTRITQKDLETAPSVEDVVENFLNWLPLEYKIFVFGNYDKAIMKSTLERSKNEKVRNIIGNMVDISKVLTKLTFGTKKVYSLLKIAQELKIAKFQNHNALDDANLLKMVFEFYQNKFPEELVELYLTSRFNNFKLQHNSGINTQYSKIFENFPECDVREFSLKSRIVYSELSSITDMLRILKNDNSIKGKLVVEKSLALSDI